MLSKFLKAIILGYSTHDPVGLIILAFYSLYCSITQVFGIKGLEPVFPASLSNCYIFQSLNLLIYKMGIHPPILKGSFNYFNHF